MKLLESINVTLKKRKKSGHAEKSQSSSDVLVKETVIDTTEESDSSEMLADQTDSVDSVYHTIFILDNNSEARQTPLQKSQDRKTKKKK